MVDSMPTRSTSCLFALQLLPPFTVVSISDDFCVPASNAERLSGVALSHDEAGRDCESTFHQIAPYRRHIVVGAHIASDTLSCRLSPVIPSPCARPVNSPAAQGLFSFNILDNGRSRRSMLPFSQTKQRLTHSLNSESISFNRGFGNLHLSFLAPLVGSFDK